MNNKYRLKIKGKNPKRYIGYLIKEKISLYDVEINNKETIILVDEDGYNKILGLKTSYKIELIEEFGIIKYRNFIRKYKIFFICILLGILFINLLSNIVFDIDIEHSKSEIRELVLNDLKEFGIEKYHFKVSYEEKEKIIKKILKKETERIEWLEIDNVGTKYIVKVEERIKNEPIVDNKTQHIIAKKSAMILEIQAESGEVIVKKNDYVEKGDVLISGFITKDEEIKKKTKAVGTVYGEVWYQVEISLPKVYKEIKYTNEKKKRVEINFLSHDFLLFDFKPYKTYESENKVLIKNKILPISINYSTIKETKETVKRYTGIEGEKEAFKLAEEKLKKKLGVNDTIISKKILKKKEKDSKIIIDIFFKVKEDITDTKNIDDINIENIAGDENGAND